MLGQDSGKTTIWRNARLATLDPTSEGLGEIAVTIHNLSHELHPANIRLLGLVQTLEALCRDIVEETGVDVRFTAEGMLSHVDEDTALCVFRPPLCLTALRKASCATRKTQSAVSSSM